MSKKPPNRNPNPRNSLKLTKAEQEALKAANNVKDLNSEENKRAMINETSAINLAINDETQHLVFYQQEREKINYNWIIAKKELEDKKGELMNKDREIEDRKENHTMALNLYKQKVKHLLFQNQDQQSDLRKDVEITLKQLEDEHRSKERELKTDNRSQKVQLKEQELSHYDYIFAMKSDSDRRLTVLRQEYERLSNEVKKKYDLKMQKLRQKMEEERAARIKQIEEKKDLKIQQLTKEHSRKYNDIKNYYSDITATNLEYIRTLKGEINKLQSKEDHDKKLLQQIERENKALTDPLKSLKEEINLLTIELGDYEKLKMEKEDIKKTIERDEALFRKMEYDYEVKLQHYKYLEREKELLSKKFVEAIYEIERKTGLENLILEKKVTTVQEILESKDLEMIEVLKSANIKPEDLGAVNQSLVEVEGLKNDLINELQQQLQQIRKAHSHMVKAYEGKLSEFVIPVEELGFDPLVPTNTD